LLLIVAVWALRDHPVYVLVTAILGVLTFLIVLVGILWFANRHPGVALLEGAELIQWRQMDIAVKSVASIENMPVLGPEQRELKRDDL
jgi:uncharacterized membrane protein YesL